MLESFERWGVNQAGLFTFASSPRHIGLYQRHGFWPGSLTVVAAKPVAANPDAPYTLASPRDEIRKLTDAVFRGLDLEREIVAAATQRIGDTIVLPGDDELDGVAVCHCGAGSEAGSDTCYVKFAAVRPGAGAADRFERLLDACEGFAADSGLQRLVAGVNTGRLDAYRRLLSRGFRIEQIGVAMYLGRANRISTHPSTTSSTISASSPDSVLRSSRLRSNRIKECSWNDSASAPRSRSSREGIYSIV